MKLPKQYLETSHDGRWIRLIEFHNGRYVQTLAAHRVLVIRCLKRVTQ